MGKLSFISGIVSFVVLTGCSSVVGRAEGGTAPEVVDHSFFEQLMVQDGRLGWAGMMIGMSRNEIEALTGGSVETYQSEGLGCGDVFGELRVLGRKITLQLDGSQGDAGVNSIYIEMLPEEAGRSAEELANRLNEKLAMRYEPSRHDRGDPNPPSSGFYLLESNPAMAVLIKPPRGFYVMRAACSD